MPTDEAKPVMSSALCLRLLVSGVLSTLVFDLQLLRIE